MESSTNLTERARAWLQADPDPDTSAELAALLDDSSSEAREELTDRFRAKLEFGTAGLRGRLGAGPNRMNRLVVRHAAGGLVRYLQRDAGIDTPLVVVGYDARHKSDVFAQDTAAVVVAAGGRAALLPRPLPTPVLAFAIRHLGGDAGVMVTASHNPPADNGYKVYLGDGAQIVPPTDARISAAIDEVAADGEVPLASSGWDNLGDDVVESYVSGALTQVPGVRGAHDPERLRIVYTPLHGVGSDVALTLLNRAGFSDVHVVAAQAAPDPDFRTVSFPNPEEPGALDLALADAERLDADLVIANDPDADRLAVCVRDPVSDGRLRALTGNEVGVLLADHVLRATEAEGSGRLVATTIVSSRMLAALAAAAGVGYAETLTGFKWIMRAAIDRPGRRFVFGYEEALGYSVTELVRDKDGLTAALAFAELAAAAKVGGGHVTDRLEELARRHGLYATAGLSIPEFGVVDRVLAAPPAAIAGRVVTTVVDLSQGVGGLPPTEAVALELAGDGGGRVLIRPSGTEPKTKVYLEVVHTVPPTTGGYAAARRAASTELDAIGGALRHLLRRE